MCIRDRNKILVKDSEGEIVRIEPHPDDQAKLDEALRLGAGTVYLQKLPTGIWVRMETYEASPFEDLLQDQAASLLPPETRSLVFIEPKTAEPFVFREYRVTRTGFPISHAKAITSTACQGRTMRDGVILDCGREEGGAYP